MDNGNQPESKSKKRKNSLLVYAAILFGVAFLLILFSYLVQQRNNRATINELNESSASAMQSMVILQEENNELLNENSELTQDAEALQKELEATQERLAEEMAENDSLSAKLSGKEEELAAASEELELTQQSTESESLKAQALEYLWQIVRQFYNGNYDSCRTIISLMEDGGLVAYLPENAILAPSGFELSPRDNYEAIKSALETA